MVTLTTISSGLGILALTAALWKIRKQKDTTPECYCSKALGVPVCSDRPNIDGKPLWTVIHDQFLGLQNELAVAYGECNSLRREVATAEERNESCWELIRQYQREVDSCQWGQACREDMV